MPDEPPIARARAELKGLGLHPASLPLGVDIDTLAEGGKTAGTPSQTRGQGKMDAETATADDGTERPEHQLETGAYVEYLDGVA